MTEWSWVRITLSYWFGDCFSRSCYAVQFTWHKAPRQHLRLRKPRKELTLPTYTTHHTASTSRAERRNQLVFSRCHLKCIRAVVQCVSGQSWSLKPKVGPIRCHGFPGILARQFKTYVFGNGMILNRKTHWQFYMTETSKWTSRVHACIKKIVAYT